MARRAGAAAAAAALCLALGVAGRATVDPYVESAKLTAADQVAIDGAGQAAAVSADGDTALIGASRDDGGLGAVWVFGRSGANWTERHKLAPPDELGSTAAFGSAIALSADGTTALVSGEGDGSGRGAVWVYVQSGGTWQEQAKLVAPDAGNTASFGGVGTSSLALSADGSTALIGGPGDNGFQGAVWVFVRSGGSWSEQAKVSPADRTSGANVGQQVALSADGNTALFGASGDAGNLGAAWIYVRSGTTWTEQQKIASPRDETGSGQLGSGVALSPGGDVALVGASGDATRGAVFEYARSGAVWSEAAKLGAPADASANADFGRSLALSSDSSTLLVGANALAWVYALSNGTWSEQQRLSVSDGSFGGLATFGFNLALSGDGSTAVVGGSSDNGGRGAAWVFARSGSAWSEQAKIPQPTDAAGSAQLGTSVAVAADGATAIVGGPNDGRAQLVAGAPPSIGAAWVFVHSSSGWTEQVKLVPSDATDTGTGVDFGSAVALSGDGGTAFIGGRTDSGPGAVWVYTRSGSTWSEQQKIAAPADSSGFNPGFGVSVAASSDGKTLLVGGSGDASNKGAVWVYVNSGSGWVEQAKLALPADGAGAASFGGTVSVSGDGNTAIVGATSATPPFSNPGAWIFTRSGGIWSEAQHLTSPPDLIGTTGSFGAAVALSLDGSTAAVCNASDNGSIGAVWLYSRAGDTWAEQQKVAPSDVVGTRAGFGLRMALSGNGATLAAGGSTDAGGAGAAWVYRRTNGAWQETQKLSPPMDAAGGAPAFGSSLALTPDATTLVAGARQEQSASGQGAAWIFTAPAAPAPGIVFAGAQPAPNAHGWNNSSVMLTWNCTNAISATVTETISTEGANQSATGTCTNAGSGSAGDTEGAVSIDLTPPNAPTVQADRTPDFAGGGGWYRDSVTVSFASAGDPKGADGADGSGVDPASVPAPETFTADGAHAAVGVVHDLASNESATAKLTVQVDATAPTLTASYSNADGSVYMPGTLTNQPVTVTFACSDSGSGVASFSPPVTLSTEGAGQSVEGSCTDNVGHTTTKSFGRIQIDTTAPEAYLAFDPAADAVEVFGTDSGSGVPAGAVAPISISGHEMTYEIVDAAGNSLVLVLRQTGKAKSVEIQVLSLSYDGGAALPAPKNDLQWSWSIEKGALATLTQDLRAGAKKAKVHVVADYSANTGKTTIHADGQTSKQPGLVLVTVATAAGKLVLDH